MFCFQLPDISQHEIPTGVKFSSLQKGCLCPFHFWKPFCLQLLPVYMQGSGRKNRCSLIGRGLALVRAQAVLHTGMVSSHLNNS